MLYSPLYTCPNEMPIFGDSSSKKCKLLSWLYEGCQKKMKISIVTPVFNEPRIPLFLRDLKRKCGQSVWEQAEIIVVDGDPAGSTIELISDPAVKTGIAQKGRARQQNFGAKMAQGAVLLFLHADTRLPGNFTNLIRKTIHVGFSGGAFDLQIDSPHPLLRFTSRIGSFRSRITGIPYGDQGIFITRSLFEKIGGFPDLPLMEDIALMLRIKKSRKAFTILPDKAVTSPRMWYKKGILYTMIRNPILALLYYLGVSPRILVRFYYG